MTRSRHVVAVGLAMLMAVVATAQEDGMTSALQATAFNFGSQPASQAEDVYKGLHQALFGPGHAIPDPDAARRYLLEEVSQLGPPMQMERPCQSLGGEPKVVRVNLRPFVARGGDLESLLEAFVASVDEVHGSAEEMGRALVFAETWLESVGEMDKAEKLDRLRATLVKQGFPAVDHSQAYSQTYQPAYRIVTAVHAAEHRWCN